LAIGGVLSKLDSFVVASKSVDNFRYFMVFNKAKLEGAISIAEILDINGGMK
jgi:hypothetical protein